MAFDELANFARSAVATAPSPATSGTSLTVETGAGAFFPTPPFNALVWPSGALPEKTNAEIVRVTAISGDVLAIARAQEGSSARAILAGDLIRAWITKKTITDIETAIVADETAVATEKTRAEAAEKVVEEAATAKAAAARAAAEAASIAVGQRGASNGVAKLESGRLPVAELPSSAVILEPKELGEVEGVTKLVGSEGTQFYAKLKGAAEFEVVPPHEPWFAELLLTPGKFTWKVKGASWLGSEPELGEGQLLLTILCCKGQILLWAGAEGRKGTAGTNGNTVWNGEGGPEESLGADSDFYIEKEGATPKKIYGPKASGKWPTGVSLKGEKGEKGETGASGASESTESSFGIVLPVHAGGVWLPTQQEKIGTALRAIYLLIRLPMKGTLHEVMVFNGSEVNGEHNVAVIDTGQAKAKEYSVLWESKGVKAEGASKWQTLGEPGLGVQELGTHLFLAVMNTGGTHTFGGLSNLVANSAVELPTGYGIPRAAGLHTFSELKYSLIKESQLENTNKRILVAARIS